MKKKLILTGTDNDGFRHRYSVKKNEGFKESFVKFMGHLGFNPEKVKSIFFEECEDKKGNFIQVELKVADFEDCIRHYQNGKFDVDIFFGKLKIIIVVRTKTRDSMVKFLENEADWIKALEARKIRENNKRKLLPLQKIRK